MIQFDEQSMVQQASQGAGTLPYKSDVRVWFYLHAIKDEVASMRLGRPIYTNAVYRSCKAIGTKDYISGPISPEDVANHPTEWAAFQALRQNPKTSIRALPRMDPAAFGTLQELEIHTIEDFAALKSAQPELAELHAIAKQWVELSAAKPAKRQARGKSENAKAAA